MPKYQTILFDLDGTLTDPKEGILNSIEYALQKFNIQINQRDELIPFIGPPLQESFQKFFSFDKEQAWQAVQYYREYFAKQGLFENKVYPGIPKLLERLRTDHRVLAVATSKPTIYSERILERFKLKQYFHLIIGSNLDGTRVAKTEVIRETLAGLSVIKNESVIMIGDREHDIFGAKNNHINSIGVTYGYGSKKELEDAGATYFAASIEELGKVLYSA